MEFLAILGPPLEVEYDAELRKYIGKQNPTQAENSKVFVQNLLGTNPLLVFLTRQKASSYRSIQFLIDDLKSAAISDDKMADSILEGRRSRYVCPVHYKREVKVEGKYATNPEYGEPLL